ncbi:ankyrin repeat domain-containing protein [Massilia antarctica]|uniref:Ankyrin repeat domain-containing protein n=1 Tax=Massilia antarctica TaxID=2765360 RepID=A0AA48WBT3_9BURK|nr:ankyrin repeat domain-containing protein [Massilia antarctica]QPI48609.1 ankyrin repeat domain-containing protein [Massilia antarctica]
MFNLIIRLLLAASLAILGENAAADPVRDFVLAAQMDNPSMVKKLLKNGVSPNTVDPLTGETVLLLALREGANDVANLLIGQPGIDLEQAAPNGNRALMMAAFKHNKPAVLALLAKGAIVTYPGWTALHYAAASGDDDIVRILLDHYAYIDAETPSKLTPLMIAAREGHESAARLLMQEGADATLKNNESLTAAQIAERADKPRIADAINAHLSLTRKGL